MWMQAHSWLTSKLLETDKAQGSDGLIQDPFNACSGSCIVTGGLSYLPCAMYQNST